MNKNQGMRFVKNVYIFGFFPCFFYMIFFCLLTFPLIRYFPTHFFADQGDGLQNVWNLWWVNQAVTQSHCSPWYTTYLHYPYGVSLVGHTLNLFNGLLAIVLLKFTTLIQAHNFIVIFSFVVGGWTAFLLAFDVSRSYWGSIFAGYVFTFSSFHFAHAQGHLQLVSLEWIPLFLLCAYSLVRKPSFFLAMASALVLFLVILCDYYYFFYSVLTFSMMLVWFAIQKRDFIFFLRRDYAPAFAVFLIGTCLTSGVLVWKLAWLNQTDPLIGVHDPNAFSIDALALLIPGELWKFSDLTRIYWSRLLHCPAEHSIYLGYAVISMLAYSLINKRHIKAENLGFWYVVFFVFLILGLGPLLHVCGQPIVQNIKLPYAVLAKVFSFINLSGCPVRMTVMLTLSAALIFACGFGFLFRNGRRKLLSGLLLSVLFVEYLPKAIPASNVSTPAYVEALKKIPGQEGIIDLVAKSSQAMYYQTIHQKPIAFGYVSRIPTSVQTQDDEIMQAIKQKNYSRLYHDYHLRYLIVKEDSGADQPKVVIQDLAKSGKPL